MGTIISLTPLQFSRRWLDFMLIVTGLTVLFYYVLFILVTPILAVNTWWSIVYATLILFFGIRAIRKRNNKYIRQRLMIVLASEMTVWFLVPVLLVPWGGLLVNPWPLDPQGFTPPRFFLTFPIQTGPLPDHSITPPIGVYALVLSLVVLPFLSYKFGRRVWCSYLCSFGGFAETVGDSVRCKAPKGKTADLFNRTSYAIIIWVAIYSAGVWALIDFGNLVGYYYNYVVVFFFMTPVFYGAFPLFGGRFWCRFLCPLGGILGIFSRYGDYAIKTDNNACNGCGVCNRNCQMGVDVQRFAETGSDMRHEKCVGCGVCISVCPESALYFKRSWTVERPRDLEEKAVRAERAEKPTSIYKYTLGREEAYRLLKEGLPLAFREVAPGKDVYVELDEEGRSRLEELRMRREFSKRRWVMPPLLCGVMVEVVREYAKGGYLSTAFQLQATLTSYNLVMFVALIVLTISTAYALTGIDRVDQLHL